MNGLRLAGLKLDIVGESGVKPILRGVDLQVGPGVVQGLAGESGSGKTMTGLAVMGLQPPGAVRRGHIWLDDTDLVRLTPRQLNQLRGPRLAMVFQDPSTSLHPQLTVGVQLTDHMRHHLRINRAEARDRALAGLNRVGISGGAEVLARYPHEFSGGQRQRVAIAIALACQPQVVIMDEPTTALDVTVQAGVLALVRDLVDADGLAVLFITHDLGVMSAIADNVAVMKDGVVVEDGPRQQVLVEPQHSYTKELLAALPGGANGLTSRDDLARLADGGTR